MYSIRFLLLIVLSIWQLDVVLSLKKAIINETKILDDNMESYRRLTKQLLAINQQTGPEKETSKYNAKITNHHARSIKNSKLLVIALDGFRCVLAVLIQPYSFIVYYNHHD